MRETSLAIPKKPAAVRPVERPRPALGPGCGTAIAIFAIILFSGAIPGGLGPAFVAGALGTGAMLAVRRRLGHRALRRALERRDARALAAIGTSWYEPVQRRQALASLSLVALERGDVESMVRFAREALAIRSRDQLQSRANLVPAIVAWLAPDALDPHTVLPSRSFAPTQADRHPLIHALEVLESTVIEREAAMVGAWQATASSGLRFRHPRLFVLLQAIVGERIPAVAAEVAARLAKEEQEEQRSTREFLAAFLPHYAEFRESGYRVDASPEPTAALVRAPSEVRTIVRQGVRKRLDRLRTAATLRRIAWGTTAAAVASLWLDAPGASLVIFTGMLTAWLGARVAEPRLRALAGALDVPGTSRAWRRELNTNAALEPMIRDARGQETYVACALAEQAIANGDIDQAWELVRWWYAGFDPETANPQDIRPTGGSLARIAALCGHLDLAERVVRHQQRTPRRARPSVNGDSAAATKLALAVIAGKRGHWGVTAALLSDAWYEPMAMAPHQKALFLTMARAARSRGHEVRRWRKKPKPEDSAWIPRVWPELLEEQNGD